MMNRMDDSEDQVIDLASYRRRKAEEHEDEDDEVRSTFTFWGGDGERARFALPLWRAAYLGGGLRAALLSHPANASGSTAGLEPLVVLDLREEEARLRFDPSSVGGLDTSRGEPGTWVESDESIAICLGEEYDRRWYMVVDDLEAAEAEVARGGVTRGDMLFLAGECAGLLFYRRLAVSLDGGEGPG
jgi:hypothetical protein